MALPSWLRPANIIDYVAEDVLGMSDSQEQQQQAIQEQRDLLAQGFMDAGAVTPSYEYEYILPEQELGDAQRSWAYADQEAVNAQYDALDQMQQWARGGLTDTDMNNMRLAQMDNARAERGAREATMNQMQARGMGGSGAELASLLGGQQTMANANNAAGLSMQIAAQDRALRSLQNAGSMASGMRDASFNEAYGRASAIDEFNRNNVENRRGVQGRNVDRYNRQEDRRTEGNRDLYKTWADYAGVQSNITPGSTSTDRFIDLGAQIGGLVAGGGAPKPK